jgi:PLP dependent protein
VSVAERVAALRARLPPGVTLVAVSKTQPASAIREAYAAGQRHFGENYAQEWRGKAEALADLPGLTWHFVGALQTNKVKVLAGRVGFVHTVDRLELAKELSKRYAAAGAVAKVFLEINLGGEAQKAGCPPEDDPVPHFRALRALRDRLGLRDLSMGMSGDWERAVAEGATFVRVGSALFGARPARAG